MKTNSNKMYLEDFIRNRPIEDTRKFLRGIYNGTYNAGAHEAFNSTFTWPWYIKKHKPTFKRGLEIGCGKGAGVKVGRNQGFNLWGVDHVHIPQFWKEFKVEDYCFAAEALNLPFKDESFDVVLIPDVLEHIPEEDIPGVLKEMRRVGSESYYALIDLGYETVPINDRLYTHITLRSETWWTRAFTKAGFLIKKIERFVKDDDELKKLGFVMEKHQPNQPHWHIEVSTHGGCKEKSENDRNHKRDWN